MRSLPGTRRLSIARQRLTFHGSGDYWEKNYRLGQSSGSGSHGELARSKASFLNEFIRERGLKTVTEFGCGDGSQLSLAQYPAYIGLDVSRSAVRICRRRFADDRTKSFFLYDGTCHVDNAGIFTADVALSLDVIFHLVEDSVFEKYMADLFGAGQKYVIIYSTNSTIGGTAPHVRHRSFGPWVEQEFTEWRLVQHEPGAGTDRMRADYFVYER
jgi:hypothetical protein